MLRAIFGGVNTEEEWRTPINTELKSLYREPRITTVEKHRKCPK